MDPLVTGTIIKIKFGNYIFIVKWDNETTNSYKPTDLEVV